jgi:hypothetical protein
MSSSLTKEQKHLIFLMPNTQEATRKVMGEEPSLEIRRTVMHSPAVGNIMKFSAQYMDPEPVSLHIHIINLTKLALFGSTFLFFISIKELS